MKFFWCIMWRRSLLVKTHEIAIRGPLDQVHILTLPVTVFREYFVAENMHKKEG